MTNDSDSIATLRLLAKCGSMDLSMLGPIADEIKQLRAAVKTAQELAATRLMEIEKLRKALKVAQQSLIEFRHAQECGPSWYTRGANGMYQQVSLWLRRGLEAVKDALGPYDDNGQYLKEMPAHEPCEQPPTDKMRLDWWESQHTLHNSLHLLYVVDGYDLEVIVDDRTVACYHGEDIRACIDAAMKGASRDASSVEVIDLRNVDFQPPF